MRFRPTSDAVASSDVQSPGETIILQSYDMDILCCGHGKQGPIAPLLPAALSAPDADP
jgi:hypothetical protein